VQQHPTENAENAENTVSSQSKCGGISQIKKDTNRQRKNAEAYLGK